ncbi:MAG: hypothetical protein COZ70_08505 [Deltaproteobacteria bacterium CG_4_8_14_3_um_filter_51_11]|nr:type I restriction endonuclease subunit R [bacterium]OIP39920.1 MAG: DEAD/DEAH box helicase [Desulfobacteraceae bacterium CG2_30_51_40]PIP47180.1 MAG: hypothetical protein COX16_05890 [Deltaproteobacteria bacterium CG23_combo_of_CG06-09_8_20_14_all_51_20]PIX19548.1 MAG: hypothetical protein COZ70_08505 [Deltaproteobacteria bacterium CG_4_8_14_3_um_filter_51_11]PIY27227.1 MAG: hypothetical protein COZ11_00670 [Deltaproteobacteria bacterium CG_4_10_14_3_um_filter_51_14]PJB34352.1 MAG: hypothe
MTPPSGYTEDALIERPAIALLASLGWQTVNAYHEFDHGASSLGRETKDEVVLKSRLREALLKLNSEASPEAVHQAIDELTRDRSRMSAAAANREVYHLLKNGVRVPRPDPDGDGETVEVVRVVEWDDPAQNDFLLCSQFWVTGEMHTRRADLVGFVNGLPLLFIELKAAHRRLETAFTGNLRDYKDTIPQLFWPNALIILSNGSQSRVGSVTAGWEHFAEWKKVGSEDEAGRVSLETMLRGVCDPARFLDLVENFCLFQEVPGGLIKLTAKNHQYLGVNNALAALPNAAFLAFTGTPLIVGEEKTRQVFGDYVSVYDFQQSMADGATVPLYYENRIPELQLVNDNLNEDMENLLEAAELDEEQEKKLEQEFGREYHLITRDDRLEAVAKNLVTHFTGRGFQGKGMMICIDKATAIRMYDKVKKYWSEKIAALQTEAAGVEGDARREIEAQMARMKETDMAVVVSQGQNEIAEMSEKGLDIRPHRKRMLDEDMETKFKNPNDPFRLVFVCAMWMTGFDVPSCSTLYLDKPMRNHTLIQTIARANRVYPGKVSGLIVDYAGVFRNLERALAIYGAAGGTGGGNKPVQDKSALEAALRQALEETRGLCREQGINLATIQAAEGFARVGLLDDAVEALVASEEIKLRYLDLTNTVLRLYKAVLPDPAAREFAAEVSPVQVIADKIRALTPPADISQVIQRVEGLLGRSIATEGYIIGERGIAYGRDRLIDLSGFDFEAMEQKFKTGRKRTVNEKLKGALAQRLMVMVRLNRTRMDYLDRFQIMIDEYNAGSLNAEEFFHQLVVFARGLDEEEKRAVGEQLTEEELALFDILTRPLIEMTSTDRSRVKATARELLVWLKAGKLVLDWRKRQQARAEVRVTIEKLLDRGLPSAYTPNLFEQKAAAVFQHVYDAYYGAGRSVYAE